MVLIFVYEYFLRINMDYMLIKKDKRINGKLKGMSPVQYRVHSQAT